MGKKTKVLIVHNYYQIPGGEDTVVANEMAMLERYGHEVLLYSRNNSELMHFSRFQKLFLPISTVFNFKTYREVKQIILENKVDIVHIHNTLSLVSPSVYYAAFYCKVPVVQTIHNFRLLCPGATFYREGHICEDCVAEGLGCAVKHACYHGSRVQTLACVISAWIHRKLGTYGRLNYICLTEFNKKKLLELKEVKNSKVFVKPNFMYKNTQSNIVDAKDRNYFIYVGRLDELKGIRILFEAWKKMGILAPKLLVCGTGPLEKWCKCFVQDTPDCNIELKGLVVNTEAKQLISKAKALLLPTQWYEGFPMTIVEAYSVGTPVIGSDMGNVGSLIQDGITGWKFTHDSAEALSTVVREADRTGFIIDKTKAEQYSIDNNYQQLTKIYEEVLG